MSEQLWQWDGVRLAAALREGAVSAVAAVESVLMRIDAANPPVNAVVYRYPEAALREAEAADAERAAGRLRGPLHGVPVTIKVNVDVKDTPTTNGVKAFEHLIAPDDAPVVRNLRAAGAIIVGKTNTPEFSMRGNTDNPLHGKTTSPWAPGASPGGSSGGAGVAAVLGFGPIHHGNDIAGSLRFPASACGVATLKPGLGRVPAYNPSAVAERGLLAQLLSVQGAICRTVADVRLATEVMIQPDARDPWHVPLPLLRSDAATRPAVALTRNAHGYPIHDGILANLDRAAAMLRAAGYVVTEVEPPPITEPAHGWMSSATWELKQTLDPLVREHGSPVIQDSFDGLYAISELVDGEGYAAAIADRTRMVRAWSEFLEEFPLVLTPFLMRPTYTDDYDETFEGLKDLFASAIYSYGINYLGLPAGNVPMDFVAGLPSGIQLVGGRFCEDLILEAMAVIEAAQGVVYPRLWE